MEHIYDATLEKCPLPLVKLRQLLKKMVPGDSCIIQISDSGSKQDIPKLLNQYGYHYQESILNNTVIQLNISYRKI